MFNGYPREKESLGRALSQSSLILIAGHAPALGRSFGRMRARLTWPWPYPDRINADLATPAQQPRVWRAANLPAR